ncbi:MAG: methylenetetrahydrofolate reductase C-terminal domain-containing protein [Phycisphaeraceae bacterium]|nr:methylenetetrahydrofolate reductase C-terminal domain-containing protein [Phycisphaeraceae bacterium]
MASKTLKDILNKSSEFAVLAELTSGPGQNVGPIKSFLKGFHEAGSLPSGFEFAGIALPQSPGGVANVEPTDIIADLTRDDLIGELNIIPHITCKDHNLNGLKSALMGYKHQGIDSLLALTGDKPAGAKPIFELESVGLLDLMQGMNRQSLLKAKPEAWDKLPQFFPGAAVSPFKYTEASQMQQYFKMEKKLICGAEFLITQLGWDWKKSFELMQYLRDRHLHVPVIGNVYLLTTKTPAPRLMHSGKLPGCFVSDALLKQLNAESFEDHVERAAQQVAMYRDMGAAGADIGGVHDFATFTAILDRANEIGADWIKYKDNLCWPRENGFYLYDDHMHQNALSKPKMKLRQRNFNLMHRTFFDMDHASTRFMKRVMHWTGADRDKGFGRASLATLEKTMKYMAFKCEDCGDCYLPENFGHCTFGGCEKGFNNAPCGDSTVDGRCGNNEDNRCAGELIYEAASAEVGGREKLRTRILAPRNPELQNSPSWINFLFGKDHTRTSPLTIVGEAINASNPNTLTALQQVTDPANAQATDNRAFAYIRALIQSQAQEKADYIVLNLDALTSDPCHMTTLIGWIQQVGRSVPVCIESNSEAMIKAGLEAWHGSGQSVKTPMVRLLNMDSLDAVLSLTQTYDFTLCVQLSTDIQANRQLASIELLKAEAGNILQKAVNQSGLQADKIIFDFNVPVLASDLTDLPDQPSQTHILFEAMKQIKQDKTLKGARCCLNVGHTAQGLPRRIGVLRAYVAVAMAYGMDTCMADAERHFGESPADKGLMALVEAYAQADGSKDKAQNAIGLLNKLRPPKPESKGQPKAVTDKTPSGTAKITAVPPTKKSTDKTESPVNR